MYPGNRALASYFLLESGSQDEILPCDLSIKQSLDFDSYKRRGKGKVRRCEKKLKQGRFEIAPKEIWRKKKDFLYLNQIRHINLQELTKPSKW